MGETKSNVECIYNRIRDHQTIDISEALSVLKSDMKCEFTYMCKLFNRPSTINQLPSNELIASARKMIHTDGEIDVSEFDFSNAANLSIEHNSKVHVGNVIVDYRQNKLTIGTSPICKHGLVGNTSSEFIQANNLFLESFGNINYRNNREIRADTIVITNVSTSMRHGYEDERSIRYEFTYRAFLSNTQDDTLNYKAAMDIQLNYEICELEVNYSYQVTFDPCALQSATNQFND